MNSAQSSGQRPDEPFRSLDFDRSSLERFLREHFGAWSEPLKIERISGGQSNPTYFLTFGNERLVLRKQPPGELLPSAHAIDREFRVISALAPSGIPVPETVLYNKDRSVVGTPFYLMHRVDGRVLHECALGSVPVTRRRDMYRSLAETLARLHNVDPEAVGLADYGRRGGFFARQITRWSGQWELSRQHENADVERLIEWLPANIPDGDASGIVHGDYRVGNVIFHPDRSDVVAILDWELSTLGHPLADLAHCCIGWHSSPDEYGGVLGVDLGAAGLPTQREFEDWYYAEAAHGLRLQPFHMAFALFRFAVVFEGIAARARAGNASDANAGGVAHLAATFARRAIEVLDSSKALAAGGTATATRPPFRR